MYFNKILINTYTINIHSLSLIFNKLYFRYSIQCCSNENSDSKFCRLWKIVLKISIIKGKETFISQFF